MPFVKLDCGMLNSTIWADRVAREVFITALLLAEPREYDDPVQEIATRNLDYTGWEAPPGWYGFVPASGPGVVDRAGLGDREAGVAALERLAGPDPESRSQDHDGRRMIRVDGGFLILNYDKYRQRDYTAAERQRRFRERKKDNTVTSRVLRVTSRHVTQAEAEAEAEAEATTPKKKRTKELRTYTPEFEAFWKAYPRRNRQQPKGPTADNFQILVDAGIDSGYLVSQAEGLRRKYEVQNIIGTGWVKTAEAWLNVDKELWREDFTPSTDWVKGIKDDLERELAWDRLNELMGDNDEVDRR